MYHINRMNSVPGLEQIQPEIAQKCSEMGFDLYEARFFHAGSRSILRIFIDNPKGVTIADCENVSNALSLLLDIENFMNGRPYTLEISSPGIDRPLKTERDFRRVYGREVTVNLKEPFSGKNSYTGIVKECSNNNLCLDCSGEVVELSLGLLLSGKEKIKFK